MRKKKESLISITHIRAVYTRENKPRLTGLTLAVAHIRGVRNHLYECGLHKTRTSGIVHGLVHGQTSSPMMT